MTVKNWFMNKNFTSGERLAISTADAPEIKRETEKAALLEWKTDFGTITRWVPKSCIMSDEEVAAELAELNTPEKCAARLAAIKEREASYQSLIDLCKAHGIRARKGWRVATMKKALSEVGVSC